MDYKKITLFQLILGIIGFLFLVSVSVTAVLNLRPLYYLDMKLLHISQESGYSEELIKENYDTLIEYNNITYSGELNFRDMPMSDTARIHFREVKRVFGFFEYAAIICGILFAAGGIYYTRHGRYGWLKAASVSSIVIPAAAGIFVAGDWENVFTAFHQIVFRNDYWLFDPSEDPVITILPDTYFFHCACLILLLVAVGSLVFYGVYRTKCTKNKRIQEKNKNILTTKAG